MKSPHTAAFAQKGKQLRFADGVVLVSKTLAEENSTDLKLIEFAENEATSKRRKHNADA
ncbi:hypothetical protein [Paraburkholderia strydomiana]|uniref:hypothetical protein n=1 Tax=Paraburkholderia strydomiana TaxID=1245417 RepID=UPI0038B75699